MELAERTVVGHIVKSGTDMFAVTAGQVLRIETSPGGAEILDVELPIGKQWEVTISVEIAETDA